MKKQPISVLYFLNTLARSGAEEHILTLLRGLDRPLFRCALVCPPEVAAKLAPDLPGDVELFPLCLRKPNQVASAFYLAQIIRQRRVDILHSHLFYSSLFASPIGWFCRVPVILETPHCREEWRKGWKTSFIVDRLVGRFVAYYIAVSNANARYLEEQKGLPRRKIVVIHNGCDLKRFDPVCPVPSGLKRSLGFDENDPILIVIGRLEPQKGHRVMLEAMPEIRRKVPNVRLVCVGEGALRSELEEQTERLVLQASVRFVGYHSNMADWLALADVTVLPSFYEGLPLVAIESLAAGRPMVATAVDGTPEVIVNEKTGLTVPHGDAMRLAEAICRLLDNPEQRREMGRVGRKWVEEHFSQERQVQKTQEFYLNALERRNSLTKTGVALGPSDGRRLHNEAPLRG